MEILAIRQNSVLATQTHIIMLKSLLQHTPPSLLLALLHPVHPTLPPHLQHGITAVSHLLLAALLQAPLPDIHVWRLLGR